MLNDFASAVLQGLTSKPKFLSSQYFYDAQGSKLFQQIMNLPEYYLTLCEYEILKNYQQLLGGLITRHFGEFSLVELGAGDGLKTKILLKNFLQNSYTFDYQAIDISEKALIELAQDLEQDLPDLKFNTLNSDYFSGLQTLSQNQKGKLVLFLGSNIGNFNHTEAKKFLKTLRSNLLKGDFLLIGFDLQKDPQIILPAYDDAQGVTKAFNLNLLARINRELGADFQIQQFRHYPLYDPMLGCAKSYLISLVSQVVDIQGINQKVSFRAWEAIHTEVSFKYHLPLIDEMAETAGFKLVKNFFDAKGYFCDSLWVAE
jgi:dimethylhistidine N-methyltransferase